MYSDVSLEEDVIDLNHKVSRQQFSVGGKHAGRTYPLFCVGHQISISVQSFKRAGIEMNAKYIVACRAVSSQRLCKHVPAATNTRATI
jgi:hypothetical protein